MPLFFGSIQTPVHKALDVGVHDETALAFYLKYYYTLTLTERITEPHPIAPQPWRSNPIDIGPDVVGLGAPWHCSQD